MVKTRKFEIIGIVTVLVTSGVLAYLAYNDYFTQEVRVSVDQGMLVDAFPGQELHAYVNITSKGAFSAFNPAKANVRLHTPANFVDPPDNKIVLNFEGSEMYPPKFTKGGAPYMAQAVLEKTTQGYYQGSTQLMYTQPGSWHLGVAVGGESVPSSAFQGEPLLTVSPAEVTQEKISSNTFLALTYVVAGLTIVQSYEVLRRIWNREPSHESSQKKRSTQ